MTPTDRFRFQTGSIKRFRQCCAQDAIRAFRFQTGSIKSSDFHVGDAYVCECFDSKLVRLKVQNSADTPLTVQLGFDSKLVRLKGFVKAMHILYAILMGRVKLIFRLVVFKVALLSTSGSAKLLGG